ncbi:LysM peptidoglycan-binding domain-containing protein [Candidatus Woesebacteria bacterium]|jgi:hypothetical protein|nr:LysM peptidoglycan-binding domain-containing protein [Candidatus Woesebacteria bacterium]MBP9687212.1 LysM peptidoglycan-binding domain-containing protein [Candidatus Woesebacteria bacterium]
MASPKSNQVTLLKILGVSILLLVVVLFVIQRSDIKPEQSAYVTPTPGCKYEDITSAHEFLPKYIVKKGDTLLSIATKETGDVSRADELVKINKDKYSSLSVKNPFLEVGWNIDLPPVGVKETNGLLYAESGRLSIGNLGWGTGYPRKSQRYQLATLNALLLNQDIKEGDCVTIIFQGRDVNGASSEIKPLQLLAQ